ncbi:MAG: hypothetical protein WCG93_01270 [Paludibacter sp.]
MKTIHITGILSILLTASSIINCAAYEMQKRKGHAKYITAANQPARASPARASPEDTINISVLINGKANTVIVNGKILPTNPDTTNQNKITVDGEGNTITVIQTDQNSEVKITQKGNNNKISISQKNQQ